MQRLRMLSERAKTRYPELPRSFSQPLWYVAYTNANHEKSVAEHLQRRSVEHFLPLYKSMRRWKDRNVCLELPLFPGYVFVQVALHDRLTILKVPGLAKLVGFNGIPTALPQKEIDALRTSLAFETHFEPHPYLTVGTRVKVKGGPLAGLEGILLKKKNRFRFVVSVELIMRSIAVEIDEAELETVG
jgi:transcription antitermination factor NusG